MSSRKHFFDGSAKHDLSHLNGFTFQVGRSATEKEPEWSVSVAVSFSWHCYTRTPEAHEEVYRVKSGTEERCFCPERYRQSHQLPEIIQNLAERKVFQTGKSNFVTIEIVEEDGTKLDYEVYFRVRKSANKELRLFVESAYIRYPDQKANKQRQRRQKIRFRIIAYNLHTGKPIKYSR